MSTERFQENIVPATQQNLTSFIPCDEGGTGLRVLFFGNSITRHRPKPDIGWYRDCGMAASCLEKDYVHLMMARFRQHDPNATFAILTAPSTLERQLNDFDVERMREARDWKPDVVISFFGANVPKDDPNPKISFGEACRQAREYLNHDGHTKFFWVEGFYIRPELDAQKRELAKECGDLYIPLGDIPLREDTHGEFNHPGDVGMEAIAECMYQAIAPVLFQE